MTVAAEVAEKRSALRSIHGGLMNRPALARELGFKDIRPAQRWAADHDIPPIRRGKSIVYETDLVARAIVMGRGMV